MLRTSAPLIGTFYVSGLKVREGWLTNGIELNRKAAIFYPLFARVLLAGSAFTCDGLVNEVRNVVAVSHHAGLWKAKLTRVSGKVKFCAGPV